MSFHVSEGRLHRCGHESTCDLPAGNSMCRRGQAQNSMARQRARSLAARRVTAKLALELGRRVASVFLVGAA